MPSLWLNLQAWCSALTQSICSINELITESMPLCHQLPPTGKAKAQKYIWITMILLEFYLTPGSRLGHFSYKSLESCLHHLLTWFYLCFHSRKMQQLSRAPGDGSPCRTEQMAPSLESTSLSGGKGCLAQWWPLVLLTTWYFPTTKGPLQLWKIFSLTSTLTINNFFIVFSHHGVLLLLGCFTERAVCQALTCLAQGGITVQLISSAWSSFLWSYLQTVMWW